MRGVGHHAAGQQTPAQLAAVRRISGQLQPEHQAQATHTGDEAVTRAAELGHVGPDAFAVVNGLLGETFIAQDIESGQRTSDGQRVAPEGAAVITRLDDIHDLGRGQEGRERHTAAQVLAQHQSVGPDAVALEGEVGARAAEASLDLVEHQRDAVGVAQVTHRRPIAVGRHDHAAFGLNGLHQEHDDVVAVGLERLLQGADVAERHTHEARGERTEVTTVLRIRRHADDGGGATVEVAVGVDDHALGLRHAAQQVGRLAHHLDGGLDGLGAGGHGKHRRQPSEQGDASGPVLDTRDGDGPRRADHTRIELGPQGGQHGRVTVTGVGDAVAGDGVQVGDASGIEQQTPFSPNRLDGERRIVARQMTS